MRRFAPSLRFLPRAALLIGLAMVGAIAACARPARPLAVPVAPSRLHADTSLAALEELARAAGAQLRRNIPVGFAVYPRFLTSEDHNVIVPRDAHQQELTEAFRDGARAHFVDTVATRDQARLAQLPDSERYFSTLAHLPRIARDTGTIELFESVFNRSDNEPYQMTIFRYLFVRDRAGAWQYQRRMLLYGA